MAVSHVDKELLIDICNDLDSYDLEKLKFLMKDVASLGKLKSATFALELFRAIENKKHVALYNGRFLAECFELMGRSDLVRQLGFDPGKVADEIGLNIHSHSVNPFRVLLYRICEDLSTKEVSDLTFYSERVFKLKRKEKETVVSAFDLFVLLEKRSDISVGNSRPLKDMMKSLDGRGDLVDLVNEYQGSHPDTQEIPDGTTTHIPNERDLHSSSSRDIPDYQQSISNDVTRDFRSAVPYYEMTSKPRGLCVIINNKQFRRMKAREGTDVDQEKLADTFGRLGFIIRIYRDLTVKDMAGVMKDISIMDHSEFNALVVCILSHGGENFYYEMANDRTIGRRTMVQGEDKRAVHGNFVYGVDENAVPIRYLTMYFKSSVCKTLADKPKLFFIQACQGAEMQTGVLVRSDFERDGPSIAEAIDMDAKPLSPQEETDATPQETDNRKVIPDEADFLLGYATVFGYVSYRSRSQGSFYVKSLTENLDNHADTLDLQQLMVKVNHDVSERNVQLEDGDAKKQVPMVQSTLRKALYFSPDNLRL